MPLGARHGTEPLPGAEPVGATLVGFQGQNPTHQHAYGTIRRMRKAGASQRAGRVTEPRLPNGSSYRLYPTPKVKSLM